MSHSGFFIVGAPRSGTTLLQTILAHHPRLYSAPETSFFDRLIPQLGLDYRDPTALVTKAQLKSIESDFRYMTGNELTLVERFNDDWSVRDVFESIMRSFNNGDKEYWVEKTTNHARAMLLIQRFYPDAKFIHVIRDPVDSIGSMIRIRPIGLLDFRIRYVSPIFGFARVWKKCVDGAFRYPYQLNVHHLFYEDLVAHPAQNISKVCAFLGVDYSDDLLDGFEQEAENILSVDHCPWQRFNTQPGFHSQTVGKARRELPSGDVWLIQRAVKEQAATFGYYDLSLKVPLLSRVRSLAFEFVRYCVYISSLELPIRRLLGALKK